MLAMRRRYALATGAYVGVPPPPMAEEQLSEEYLPAEADKADGGGGLSVGGVAESNGGGGESNGWYGAAVDATPSARPSDGRPYAEGFAALEIEDVDDDVPLASARLQQEGMGMPVFE